jgi:hypothetical protein
MSDETKRTIGEMSYDTRIIVEMLSKVETSAIVTYDEMTEIIDKNIHEAGVLYSAIRIIRRDYGIVFETVRKVGFKRMSDIGILNSSISILPQRMRSLAKRESKKLACVKNDNITDEMRIKRDMSLSLIGALDVFSQTKNLKRLEATITKESGLPPMKDIMLSLCGGK